ncbi:tetratricopeptide repeat protein [Parasporobacterium paucivorans]|uniref:Uncharacterized conserved protein n=1 Tax=Parasporobacterium paucivorans DSM 15970 TaxID=1122934 RepID=A0A1M6JYF6_9FIRM|nr:tetratricopeptide repeat protein [Parasporobacterium paucivorans]SHJ51724.1 Uncharacterized conserved protein [Parasporobacterium paucivorans DSM 15970]
MSIFSNESGNAYGEVTFAGGKKYIGEFKDGKPHGKGAEFFSNGDRYEGEFKDGLRSGQGTKTYVNGDRYEGSFEEGKFHGYGIFSYSDGNKYEGEWIKGKPNGQGTRIFANGDKYVGGFRNYNFHGRGIWISANGDKYEGEFKDGKFNGLGTLHYRSGDKYEGKWEKGVFHGYGILTYADGTRKEGEFEDGKLKYGYENRYEEEFTKEKVKSVTHAVVSSPAIQEIRIFISSTFMDLNDERKYLMNRIFPVFAARLRRRGVDLNVIDLRWGIQPEERAAAGKCGERNINKNTLEICLKEVDRCYPFFIGIIGGRYGWIPELEDVDLETDFYKRNREKIASYLSQRKSMTEMEILFGTLERQDAPIDYRFYIGDEDVYQDSAENYAACARNRQVMQTLFKEAVTKQKALRKRLIGSGKACEKTFKNPASLGESILKDMEMLIEELEQQGKIPTVDLTEDELRLLEIISFEKQKTKGYVGREAEKILDRYLELLLGKTEQEEIQPLFITGPSGTGKSTMIARWSKRLEAYTQLKVIKIYIGLQNNITTQSNLIKQLLTSIKKEFGIEREIPQESELRIQFETWLSYINGPALIIIDGMDQLTDYSGSMGWIPASTHFPIGMIVTSTGSIRPGKRELPVNEYRITGFTTKEKENFINEYLIKSARSMSEEGRAALMGRTDELGNNPLFVYLILQELIRSGRKDIYSEDEIRQKNFSPDSVLGIITLLLSSHSMEELFIKLYTRYENDYGKHLTEQMLSLIELTRKGIYYKELVDLVSEEQGKSLSGTEFQSLFSVIEDNLIRISGKYAFHHAYLKNAVQKKYGDREREYREQMAAYFNQAIRKAPTEADLHHAEELTYHLARLGKWEELLDAVSNPKILYWMLSYYENEMSGYFKNFKEMGIGFSDFYEKIKDTIKTDVKLKDMLGWLFLVNGENELSIRLFEEQESETLHRYGEDEPNLWIMWEHLANAYLSKGEWDKAIGLFQKVEEKRGNAYREESQDLWTVRHGLAAAYLAKGEYDKAVGLFQRVAAEEEQKHGEENPGLWKTWNALAEALRGKGEFEEAINLLRKTIAKQEDRFGEDDPVLWTMWNNLANAYLSKGEWDKAIDLLQRVTAKREERYGTEFPGLWRSWSNLSSAYKEKGELEKSIELLQKVTEKQEQKYGDENPDLWTMWTNLALDYSENKEFDKAVGLLEKVMHKQEERFGEGYHDLWKTWACLSKVYTDKGEYEKAADFLHKAKVRKDK